MPKIIIPITRVSEGKANQLMSMGHLAKKEKHLGMSSMEFLLNITLFQFSVFSYSDSGTGLGQPCRSLQEEGTVLPAVHFS